MSEVGRSEIASIIWAECDAMLSEGTNRAKISSRKIAERANVNWSHTTCSKHVSTWHKARALSEQEALDKTQMSLPFVRALQAEVEERVAKKREVDAIDTERLAQDNEDLIALNAKLEKEVDHSNQENQELLSQLATLRLELSQAKDLLEKKTTEAQIKHKEYEEKLIALEKKHLEATQSSEEKHQSIIDKLNTRIDDKAKEVSNLAARTARAEIKAEQFDALSIQLQEKQSSLDSLTSTNLSLKSELEATKSNITNIKDNLVTMSQVFEDAKSQRDKAQAELIEQGKTVLSLQSQVSQAELNLSQIKIAATKAGLSIEELVTV